MLWFTSFIYLFIYRFIYLVIFLVCDCPYFQGLCGLQWSGRQHSPIFPHSYSPVHARISTVNSCGLSLCRSPDSSFMAAGPVIYFHIYIHSLHRYGKFSLMQTNLKTFISLTSIVLSPFCINSVHGKVPVLSIITCPNYTMQFLVRTGAIMRNMGILI